MTERSLQVTYRKGKPFAAYLHLSHHQTGEKSAKTVPSADGLLVVGYAKDGKPIGFEITAATASGGFSGTDSPRVGENGTPSRSRPPRRLPRRARVSTAA